MTSINIHGATEIKINSHRPGNNNCMTLAITTRNCLGHEDETEITVFGLPEAITDALINSALPRNAARVPEAKENA